MARDVLRSESLKAVHAELAANPRELQSMWDVLALLPPHISAGDELRRMLRDVASTRAGGDLPSPREVAPPANLMYTLAVMRRECAKKTLPTHTHNALQALQEQIDNMADPHGVAHAPHTCAVYPSCLPS